MEEFCYDEATIYNSGLAQHYETGEPLPRELFAKLKEQKTYQAAMGMVRQLYFGALDMALHHTYTPGGETTPFDYQKELAEREVGRRFRSTVLSLGGGTHPS